LALPRFAVLLPLSRTSPERPDCSRRRPGVPCPARLHPGRATPAPIASSCRSSRRRRGRPCWGAPASAQTVMRSVAPT
jgi:hypothetical protein